MSSKEDADKKKSAKTVLDEAVAVLKQNKGDGWLRSVYELVHVFWSEYCNKSTTSSVKGNRNGFDMYLLRFKEKNNLTAESETGYDKLACIVGRPCCV